MGSPETSATSYQSTQRNVPKQRCHQLLPLTQFNTDTPLKNPTFVLLCMSDGVGWLI